MNKNSSQNDQRVLDLVMDMSVVLLSNGAEIFRVEETMHHICSYFKIEDVNSFVLSNGIFLTARIDGKDVFAKVKHIPLSGANLAIVTAVNDLSRQICSGNIEVKEAESKLKKIKIMPSIDSRIKIVAAGLGSASFGYLLEDSIMDCFFTVFIAMILYTFILFCEKHKLSKVILNTVGGAFVTFMAVILYSLLGESLNISIDKVIIGSILPLVPGLAFVNAIRDIANSDFISGIVRLIDSVLVFVYIAIGVGTALSMCSEIIGKVVL